jgi:hypothetical protein
MEVDVSESYAQGPAVVVTESREGMIRNPIVVWLLSLVTLGIYYLVWYYKVNREVAEFDARITVSPGMAVVAITFGAFIIVPPFVSTYNTGERISQAQRAAGLEPTCSGIIGLLLSFLWGLNSAYYQAELNKIWERDSFQPYPRVG